MEYWMYGIDPKRKKGSAKQLKSMGFTAVVTGYDKETSEAASKAGLAHYVCMGTYTYNAACMDESYLALDINSKRQLWFGSTCPCRKDVIERALETADTIASDTDTKGVFIDGARFSSPCSSGDIDSFFTCFCSDCEKKAVEYGIDFEAMRADVKKTYDMLMSGKTEGFDIDHLKDWFKFRRIHTTEFLKEFSSIVRDNKKETGIFIFPPSLSCIVGQSYRDLTPYMDIFSPMIYRNFKEAPGPACLNHEIAALCELLPLEMVSRYTRIPLDGYMTPDDIRKGLPSSVIGIETKKAKDMAGDPSIIAPIILLDDDHIQESIQEAEKAGAEKVIFFHYDPSIVSSKEFLWNYT
jgi:hypothetical protein